MTVTAGWIGLGAMGSGMASSLLSQGFTVKAYDVYKPSLEAAVAKGAVEAKTPRAAAEGVQVLALMVVNAAQVEDVLFGAGEVAEALSPSTSIICFSTVPPTFLAQVRRRLDALGKNIGLCDSPVSGGFIRAAEGQLSIMVSGSEQAIENARPVLEALTRGPHGKLAVVGDQVGQASDFKLINQVLCAIHIALSGEAMALGVNLGANPRKLYNALRDSSFMFGNRVPWQLRDDGVPKSAMTIIHKDIGIVMDEARLVGFSAPLCAIAEQVFTAALGVGLQKEDDGNVVKLWEKLGGRHVKESGCETEEEKKALVAGSDIEIAAIETVRDLLNGVYLAAAAEALAFARAKKMNLIDVLNVVTTSAAASEPLVSHQKALSLPAEYKPLPGQVSAADTLASLNRVIAWGKRTNTPLFLTQAAQQQFTALVARGLGEEGASIVGRLWN